MKYDTECYGRTSVSKISKLSDDLGFYHDGTVNEIFECILQELLKLREHNCGDCNYMYTVNDLSNQKINRIITFLLDNNGKIDLNMIARMHNDKYFSDADWNEFCSLIGYEAGVI